MSRTSGWLPGMTIAHSKIRITDPVGLLSTVPTALGFHPCESVVLLCFRNGRLGPVMRADLPDGPASIQSFGDLVDQLGAQAGRYGDTAMLLLFSIRTDVETLARCGLAVLRRRLPVADVMMIDGSRVSFLPDDAGATRPPMPIPLDDDTSRQLSAAHALTGRSVLPDREALRASVAPPVGHLARIARHHLEVAAIEIGHGGTRGGTTDPATELFVLRAEHDHRHRLSGASAARLTVLSRDAQFRDRLIAHIMGPRAGEWIPVLVAALARIPGAGSEDLCAVLVTAAYRAGDGALAQICADRALDTDPRHRLTLLMVDIMGAGLPPDSLDGLDAAAGPPHPSHHRRRRPG